MRRLATQRFSSFLVSKLGWTKSLVVASALLGPVACDSAVEVPMEARAQTVDLLLPPPEPTDSDSEPTEMPVSCYVDADGDGVGGSEVGEIVIGEPCPDGTSQLHSDCDDADPAVARAVTCYPDADGDGVGDSDDSSVVCADACDDVDGWASIPDSACPDSAADADVDSWVRQSLLAQCISENREFTATSGAVQCQNTGTNAKPRRKETQVWQITVKPQQILMGQATACYATALPVVAGQSTSGRLPDDADVMFQGATANMPQEPYYSVGSSSQLEVVVPFKASLASTTDYTSSSYDNIVSACANDGSWKVGTYSAGAPTTTPELISRFYSATYPGDDDDCMYLEVAGGATHPSTGNKMFGLGTAFKADVKTLEAVTTDLSQCNLDAVDDATAHLPTFSIFVDGTPFFGMGSGSYTCGFDEDFEYDVSKDQQATYCDEAMAQYKDGLLGALESKWDAGAAAMQDGLQSIVGGILQIKDITERKSADGSSAWSVAWGAVSYNANGITFTVTHTRNEVGKCK